MLDLGRADAEGERTERAMGRGVAVAAHQRHARQGEALLRADDVADALAPVALAVIFEPEQRGVLRQIGDLRGALGIRIGGRAIGGRHVVVGHQQRPLRRADLQAGEPQRRKRLRAVHLVGDLAVDIKETGAVRLGVDHMVVPDLVVEGTGPVHA